METGWARSGSLETVDKQAKRVAWEVMLVSVRNGGRIYDAAFEVAALRDSNVTPQLNGSLHPLTYARPRVHPQVFVLIGDEENV